MGLTRYPIPVGSIELLVLSCMCPLVIADAHAEEFPVQATVPAWSARTEFGGFDFFPDPGFTQIVGLSVHFAGYLCGGVRMTGNIRADGRNMWPIESNSFHARTNLGICEIVLSGMIDKAGKSARGTWSINASGTICSGSWETD